MALQGFTTSTLRPDYSAMVGSSYDLQTALNRQAMQYLTPSTGVTGGLSQLARQYKSAYGGGATGALEAGYGRARQDITSGYSGALGALANISGQQAADTRSSYGQQQASMMQGLARTGMAGTTVAPSMQLGVKREEQSSLNRLADLFSQQKAGLYERQGAALGGLEAQAAQQKAAYTQQAGTNLQEIIAGVTSAYGPAGIQALINALGQMGR